MATEHLNTHDDLSHHKLDSMQLNGVDLAPYSQGAEIDRLAIKSPTPRNNLDTMLKSPRPAIMSYASQDHTRARAASPTGSVRSSFGSRRLITRSSRWSGGFSRSHRSEMSKELTTQAESEFFALMELMSSLTRRSGSLKEVWMKMMAEREESALELDRMAERFEEYTETIERKEREQQGHHHDHEEQKRDLVRIRLELQAAVSGTADMKRKLAEKDHELVEARREVIEFKDNFKYLKEEHETTKTSLHETHLNLVASQEACRHAEDDAKKHHGELRGLRQRYAELESTHTEIVGRHDSLHKEVLSLKQLSTVLKKEKQDWLHEKGELEERMRKYGHREEELERKLIEVTESWEKKKLEVREMTETLTKIRYEREELHKEIADLKRQLEEIHRKWDTTEGESRRWKLKWEQSESELSTVREEIRIIQIELVESRDFISKKTEEIRRLIVEKENIEEDYHSRTKEVAEHQRQIVLLQESLRRTETIVKEKVETIHTLHERVERIESERNDAHNKRDDLHNELVQLRNTMVSLNLQIETITADREGLREKLQETEARYEEMYETEFQEGGNDFEYEITNLRSMLREAREQKEKAIAMRSAADHERDESIARYEAKCREMEKLEETYASMMHASGKSSGGRTIKRFFSTSTSAGGAEKSSSFSHSGALESS
jgi:chromosome segregation ATPase